MQIKPVTKANKPEYPTASEIDIPKVLNASKPNNWKRNTAIGAVMLGMMMSMNGSEQIIPQVAPLFSHGHGVAAFGCVMVCPPVFMNESEAKRIIYQEFVNNNIKLDTSKNSSIELTLYLERNLPWDFWGLLESNVKYMYKNYFAKYKAAPENYYKSSIKSDAISLTDKLVVIFISMKDDSQFEDLLKENTITIFKTNLYLNATKVRTNWSNKDYTLAVFYDPIHYIEYENMENENSEIRWQEARRIAKNQSKDSLRAQVRDFLAWYKGNKGKK